MGEFVRLEVDDGVGTIRLDRPKMNAISLQVQDELRDAAAEATERDDVKAVVVYGGERVFAAGNDVKEMAELSYADMVTRPHSIQSAVTAVARDPQAGRRRRHRLRAGRRVRARAGRRRPLRRRRRRARPARDAARHHPRRRRHPAADAGWSGRAGPRTSSSPAASSKADEALAIGLVDRLVPGRRGLRRGRGLGRAVRRRRVVRRARGQGEPSTAASRSTWRPAWRSSASSSPRCSPPRTAPSACARSWRTGPGKARFEGR